MATGYLMLPLDIGYVTICGISNELARFTAAEKIPGASQTGMSVQQPNWAG